jgi:hypothetical protein
MTRHLAHYGNIGAENDVEQPGGSTATPPLEALIGSIREPRRREWEGLRRVLPDIIDPLGQECAACALRDAVTTERARHSRLHPIRRRKESGQVVRLLGRNDGWRLGEAHIDGKNQ